VCTRGGCNARYKTKMSLNTHIRADHMNIINHRCPYENCNVGFYRNSDLRDHLKKYHNDDKASKRYYKNYKNGFYYCNNISCDRFFASVEDLREHKKTHEDNLGIEKISCRFCEKSFKSKSNRKQHEQRVHLSKQKHICRYTNCNAAFETSLELHMHQYVKSHFNTEPRKVPTIQDTRQDSDQSSE
jgi:hypothetical protein